jgi:D-isomer specific 2-hydroxyacid dehydrogenase-like protein
MNNDRTALVACWPSQSGRCRRQNAQPTQGRNRAREHRSGRGLARSPGPHRWRGDEIGRARVSKGSVRLRRYGVELLDRQPFRNQGRQFAERATVTVFYDHLADSDAVVERLQLFDIVCVMRERTPMTRTIIERLPKLRMIASTGSRNASIDLKAAEEQGVRGVHTGYTSAPTIELTWALILTSARNLIAENTSLRPGGCRSRQPR